MFTDMASALLSGAKKRTGGFFRQRHLLAITILKYRFKTENKEDYILKNMRQNYFVFLHLYKSFFSFLINF